MNAIFSFQHIVLPTISCDKLLAHMFAVSHSMHWTEHNQAYASPKTETKNLILEKGTLFCNLLRHYTWYEDINSPREFDVARPHWPTAGAMACCQHGNRQTEHTDVASFSIRFTHRTTAQGVPEYHSEKLAVLVQLHRQLCRTTKLRDKIAR